MSSDTMISVENVGKLYTLKHKRSGESYTMLRDGITRQVAASFRSFSGKLRNRAPSNATATHGPGPVPSRNSVEAFLAIKGVSFQSETGIDLRIIGRNVPCKSTLLEILY